MLPVLPTMRFPNQGGVMSVLQWQQRAQLALPGTQQFFEGQIFSRKSLRILSDASPFFFTPQPARVTLRTLREIVDVGTTPDLERLVLGGTAISTGDVSLLASWGPGAAVTGVSGNDSRGTITVTTDPADTPGTNPTLTLTFVDGAWASAPIAIACMDEAGNAATFVVVVSNCTTTTMTLMFVGTPAALTGRAYKFNYHVIG